MKNFKVYLPFLAIALMGVFANLGWADTVSTEFQPVETALAGWAKGGLGRTLALGMFLVGTGVGIARQSLMSIAVGLGGGMALFYMPDVITGIVSATIL